MLIKSVPENQTAEKAWLSGIILIATPGLTSVYMSLNNFWICGVACIRALKICTKYGSIMSENPSGLDPNLHFITAEGVGWVSIKAVDACRLPIVFLRSNSAANLLWTHLRHPHCFTEIKFLLRLLSISTRTSCMDLQFCYGQECYNGVIRVCRPPGTDHRVISSHDRSWYIERLVSTETHICTSRSAACSSLGRVIRYGMNHLLTELVRL